MSKNIKAAATETTNNWSSLEASGLAKRKALPGKLAYYYKKAEASFWDEHWQGEINIERYERAEQGSLGELREAFLRYLPKESPLLEAGCGLGHLVLALRTLGYDCIGVDTAKNTIEHVNKIKPDLPIRFGDVTALREKDGFFSGYISLGVVEHREEGPEPFIEEAYRVLAPGGIAIFTMPHYSPLRQVKTRLGFFNSNVDGMYFYQYAYNENSISSFLTKAGFSVLDGYRYNSPKGISDEFPVTKIIFKNKKIRNYIKKNKRIKNYAGHTTLLVCKKPYANRGELDAYGKLGEIIKLWAINNARVLFIGEPQENLADSMRKIGYEISILKLATNDEDSFVTNKNSNDYNIIKTSGYKICVESKSYDVIFVGKLNTDETNNYYSFFNEIKRIATEKALILFFGNKDFYGSDIVVDEDYISRHGFSVISQSYFNSNPYILAHKSLDLSIYYNSDSRLSLKDFTWDRLELRGIASRIGYKGSLSKYITDMNNVDVADTVEELSIKFQKIQNKKTKIIEGDINNYISNHHSALVIDCGYGESIFKLKNSGIESVGVTFSKQHYQLSKSAWSDLPLYYADSLPININNSSYNSIVVHGRHIFTKFSQEEIIAEANRLLKSNGKAVFIFERYTPVAKLKNLFGKYSADIKEGAFFDWMHDDSNNTIILKKHGFDVESYEPLGVTEGLARDIPILKNFYTYISRIKFIKKRIKSSRAMKYMLGAKSIYVATKP